MGERLSYHDLDAFKLSDGRVMVTLGEPNHRVPEEFVPVAEADRWKQQAWDDAQEIMRLTEENTVLRGAVQAARGDLTDGPDIFTDGGQ